MTTEPWRVKFTYFKPGGKYYTVGWAKVDADFNHYEAVDIARGLLRDVAPGLSGSALHYHVVVEPIAPGHDSGVPHLINVAKEDSCSS